MNGYVYLFLLFVFSFGSMANYAQFHCWGHERIEIDFQKLGNLLWLKKKKNFFC